MLDLPLNGCLILSSISRVFFIARTMWWCRVSFIIAFLLLLTGAALNDQRGKERKYFGGNDCYVVKPGVFSGGAVLSLASVALGIIYYVALLSKTAQAWDPQQNEAIAMGHPGVPAQATPVFVHEDTYNRQQFPWRRYWLVLETWSGVVSGGEWIAYESLISKLLSTFIESALLARLGFMYVGC